MNYSPQFEGLYKCGSPRKLETLFWLGSVRFAPGWLHYYSTIQFTYSAFHNTYRFKAALKKMHVYITI